MCIYWIADIYQLGALIIVLQSLLSMPGSSQPVEEYFHLGESESERQEYHRFVYSISK